MTLNQPTLQERPRHISQIVASLFRGAANRLEGAYMTPPKVSEIRKGLKYDVEVALLDAEAELERYRHTVAMLRERLMRLSDDARYPTAPLPAGTEPGRPGRIYCQRGDHGCVPVPADRGVTARVYDETRIERRDSL